MDPLSLTASIIAIVQLANKIITLGLDLHASLKVGKDLDRIVDEVDSLRGILQRLARLAQTEAHNNTSTTPVFGTIFDQNGALATCRSELTCLEAELLKAKSSHSRFGLDAVKRIGMGKELESRLEKLSRAKQTLQLSLTLDNQ
jgi:hypothetical protein